MKLKLISLLLTIILVLTGCSWPDGSYHSITPHQEQPGALRTENLSASNYEELLDAMEAVVFKGSESSIINAVNYDPELLETHLAQASRYIQQEYPVGAYAVESLNYQVGSNTGKTAVALTIAYRHTRTEIRNIRRVRDVETVRRVIGSALEDFDTVLVIQMETYEEMDVTQIVQDYALENPQKVMEIPQVTTEIFGMAESRIMELKFSYQTSRDALRNMQAQVQPVFASAALYVSGEGSANQKFSQLYAFLMERFDYTIETSITPAYSLLRHGVGDSRAFATVYGAMCRAAGLDCMVVTGTRSGEPWTWNIVGHNGSYSHVDLLRCNENGRFRGQMDDEMTGYVWDYSAYPPCVSQEGPEEMFFSENEK